MDDDRCQQFFSEPTNPYHRRYEALRAVFVDGRPRREVADAFGYSSGTLCQLIHEFRQHCRQTNNDPADSPFFDR